MATIFESTKGKMTSERHIVSSRETSEIQILTVTVHFVIFWFTHVYFPTAPMNGKEKYCSLQVNVNSTVFNNSITQLQFDKYHLAIREDFSILHVSDKALRIVCCLRFFKSRTESFKLICIRICKQFMFALRTKGHSSYLNISSHIGNMSQAVNADSEREAKVKLFRDKLNDLQNIFKKFSEKKSSNA
ncbi:hypothetical protein AVEN_258879-1 [Araneus ventricosus]|uniref:Uncharacterized protein n=1 Tax=Araneus ventricosus TaxID=182803 RepID=A0A4Y2D6D8_ARAVE|nr:hypothetical protein AVEN_258879-1 [Araneus ventricosus]